MPPKKGTKKVNEKKDGTNLASNSTGYAGLPIEFESDMGTKPHIDRRAEQNRDLKKRQLSEQKDLQKLNVLLHQEEVQSQNGDLPLLKAQLKQLRQKLVCGLFFAILFSHNRQFDSLD